MSIVGPSAAELLAYQRLQQVNSYVVQPGGTFAEKQLIERTGNQNYASAASYIRWATLAVGFGS